MGIKTIQEPNISIDEIEINQWDAYEMVSENISTGQALLALLKWMEKKELKRIIVKTQILIAPSYSLKIAKGIVTNFHQPASTLLLLVAAVVGKDWRNIYDYALANDFRFLSYGDGCLLWKNDEENK